MGMGIGIVFTILLTLSSAQVFTTECFEEGYHLIVDLANADTLTEALAVCNTLTNGNGTLASVRNRKEYDRVQVFLDNVTDDLATYYLGIEKPQEEVNNPLNQNLETRPQTMRFIDGFPDISFFSQGGVFPWSVVEGREPRSATDLCVLWARTDIFVDFDSWNDVGCVSAGLVIRRPLCRSSCLIQDFNLESQVLHSHHLMIAMLTIVVLEMILFRLYKKYTRQLGIVLQMKLLHSPF